MGHHSHHQHNNHSTTSDGVSHQRLNSPRFSGPMTCRAHSFKNNNNIINSINTTSTSSSISNSNNNNNNSNSGNNGGSSVNFTTHHHEIELQINSPRSEANELSQRVFRRKANTGIGIGSVVVEFKGLKERKKLRHWMFLVFCGLCLFLGVFRICVSGWFGSA